MIHARIYYELLGKYMEEATSILNTWDGYCGDEERALVAIRCQLHSLHKKYLYQYEHMPFLFCQMTRDKEVFLMIWPGA